MDEKNVYVNGMWRVYSLFFNNRKHYFIGKVGEKGYYWVSPTKKGAIQICDAANSVYENGEL